MCAGLTAEEDSASVACTGDLALAGIEQMLMSGREFSTAKLAPFCAFGGGTAPRDLAKKRRNRRSLLLCFRELIHAGAPKATRAACEASWDG